jgi:putative transcriptional regulator
LHGDAVSVQLELCRCGNRSARTKVMHSRTGQLLIAASDLRDPNFFRSVVLIIQDGQEQGTLGLVLNRPLGATVKDAFEEELHIACADESPLYRGGPVEQMLTLLHTNSDIGDIEVIAGVYFTSRKESIESILLMSGESEVGKPTKRRFFVGYSGWSVGQLDAEIEAGGWILHPATEEHIFEMTTEEQWNKLIAEVTLGKWVKPDRVPEDPTVN